MKLLPSTLCLLASLSERTSYKSARRHRVCFKALLRFWIRYVAIWAGLKPATPRRMGNSLIEVECQGACSNAPMMVVNDDFYEDLTPETTKKVLDSFSANKKPKPGPQSGRHTVENSAGFTALTSKPYGPGEHCTEEFR